MSNAYKFALQMYEQFRFKDQAAFDGYPYVVRYTWSILRRSHDMSSGRFLELLNSRDHEELIRYSANFLHEMRDKELGALKAIAYSYRNEFGANDQLRSIQRYCERDDATLNGLCMLLKTYTEKFPLSL